MFTGAEGVRPERRASAQTAPSWDELITLSSNPYEHVIAWTSMEARGRTGMTLRCGCHGLAQIKQ